MAKPKSNRTTPNSNTAVSSNTNTTAKASLEKMLPILNASFETASKVFGSCNEKLDISVDQNVMAALVKAAPAEQSNAFKNWLQSFADTCKTLSNYQDKLEAEYRNRWEDCNSKGQELKEASEQLEAQQKVLEAHDDQLKHKEEHLREFEFDLERKQQKLAQDENDLTSRDRKVSERERIADAGFSAKNREALERLKSEQTRTVSQNKIELDKLSEQKSRLERAIADAEITLTETEQQRQQKLEQRDLALKKREHELEKQIQVNRNKEEQLKLQQAALNEEKQNYQTTLDIKNQFEVERLEKRRQDIEDTLNIERKQLDQQWQDLQEAKQNFEDQLEEALAEEQKSHQEQRQRMERRLEKTWEKIDALKKEREDYQQLKAIIGEQTPETFIQAYENLKQENRNLSREHSATDSAAVAEENDALRSRIHDLENQLTELHPKLEQAKAEASKKRIAATELNAAELEKRVLTKHNSALQLHIDDLESRIDKLTDAHKTQTPFPAMSVMDTNRTFQATQELEIVPDLKEFAEELQHRIAQAEKVKLYYPLEDIRVLLAGLSMSQLHVFQGISGTGKTSLAKAFAKAMGGFCTDIAVQAGWRDRDDLLGHYNAFERRFYEKDCLQALYQAQTPRWRDTCNVILLDEMNLSRPEQYFSEFLSALEKNDYNERVISLSETALPNAPKMLRKDRQILVPRNVWFIGTANHDETTNELADKTYDRAHVMTLPRQDERFEINKLKAQQFSFKSLQEAFNKARQKHTQQVNNLLNSLTRHEITDLLANDFDLGWGNRFEQQAKHFIPVMIAAGASEGQALDHLLSTRIMRNGKVTGRYDITADTLGKLTDSLTDFWSRNNVSGDPEKSLQLLEADRLRKKRGL